MPFPESHFQAALHQQEQLELLAGRRNTPPGLTTKERNERFHHAVMAENNALLAIAGFAEAIYETLGEIVARTALAGSLGGPETSERASWSSPDEFRNPASTPLNSRIETALDCLAQVAGDEDLDVDVRVSASSILLSHAHILSEGSNE